MVNALGGENEVDGESLAKLAIGQLIKQGVTDMTILIGPDKIRSIKGLSHGCFWNT